MTCLPCPYKALKERGWGCEIWENRDEKVKIRKVHTGRSMPPSNMAAAKKKQS